MSKAEREVATATDGLSAAEPAWKAALRQFMKANIRYKQALERIAFGPTKESEDYAFTGDIAEHFRGIARAAIHAPSLPEAVAGNASAPVGESQREMSIQEFAAELYQVCGVLNAPAPVLDQLVAAAQGKPLPYTTLLPFHGPLVDKALAGQPSGVGEPRERCPECAVADQLQCVLDKGHEGDCRYAEWPYRAREVGEGLREALEKHEYMNGSCLCREFRLPPYGKKELDEWALVRGDWMRDIRWKYWLEHVLAALAAPAPAPKPAPAAEPPRQCAKCGAYEEAGALREGECVNCGAFLPVRRAAERKPPR